MKEPRNTNSAHLQFAKEGNEIKPFPVIFTLFCNPKGVKIFKTTRKRKLLLKKKEYF